MQEAQLQLAGTVVHPDLQRTSAPRHFGPGDSGLDLGELPCTSEPIGTSRVSSS